MECNSKSSSTASASPGSVGSKAHGGQSGSGVYGSSVAPVVSQASSSFSHSAATSTSTPYSTDTATDYSQYSQAYTQVLQLKKSRRLRRLLGLNWGSEKHGGWIDRCMMSAAVTGWAVTRGGRDDNGYGYLDRPNETGFGSEHCVSPSVPITRSLLTLHSEQVMKSLPFLLLSCLL